MSLPRRPIVLVCGGRDFTDEAFVHRKLDCYAPRKIIHGGATGVDTFADRWAFKNSAQIACYFADWSQGRKAGPLRNQQMLDSEEEIHFVIAFPGGKGTADMVRRARAKGLTVYEIEYTP